MNNLTNENGLIKLIFRHPNVKIINSVCYN